MTVLESRFEQVADAIDAGDVLHYEYDLKFDVMLKEPGQTVHGKPILLNTINILKQAVRPNEVIEFFDIQGNQFHPELLNGNNDNLGDMFCTEIGGPDSKIFMFGMKIQTTVSYANLKSRIHPALTASRIYMKLHHGGFEYGVNWNQLGFFIGKHPGFVDKSMLMQSVLEKFANAWKHDKTFWTKEKKQKLQEKFQTGLSKFDPMSVPLVVTSNAVSFTVNDKALRTQTATIMIPFKFYSAGKTIMDYLLLQAKTIDNYIPHALKREDTLSYTTILQSHAKWMHEHRNIQITNIPSRNSLLNIPGKRGITLQAVIDQLQSVLDHNYDRYRQRVNISVNVKDFVTLLSTIEKSLINHAFEYKPQLKQVNIKNPSDTESTKTTKSRYTTALSGIISLAGQQSLDASATYSSTSPWTRRTVPATINFTEPDPNNFPSLPSRSRTQANADANSDTQETVATNATTISMSVFQDALTQVEANHKREMESLKLVFQAELETLKQQLIHQQQDQHIPQTNSVETKLDMIMRHLQLSLPTDDSNPTSPPRKRRDQSNTPVKNHFSPYTQTDEEQYPDTTLHWDSEEEEQPPSSQDTAMAMSGSEN